MKNRSNLSRFKPLLWALCGVLAAACSTPAPQFSCQGTDWFELGRRDGTAGQATTHMDSHRNECGKDFNKEAETYYVSGYNKGLVDYCSVENGYVIGRSGNTPKEVCPNPMDRSFKVGYARGQRVYQLERANSQIDRKISSINQQLKSKNIQGDQKKALNTELSQLESTRTQNNKELGKIEKRSQNL